MKSSIWACLGILVASMSGADAETATKDWRPMFNGKDLSGWIPKVAGFPLGENPGNLFRVEDGLLKVCYEGTGEFQGQFGHLFYQTSYRHYRIRGEFRFTGEQQKGGPIWAFRNSGFMLHSQAPESMDLDQKFPNSIEMQFWGNDPERGIETSNRPMGNLFTPGTKVTLDGQEHEGGGQTSKSEPLSGLDWVTVEAEVHGGDEIIHRVNGKEVLRYQNPRLDDGTPLTSGSIAIQAESHPIEFRKIEILPMEEEPEEK